ncbi:MAG: hypothetical protein RL166_867 [Actinomycetota bacterium]
MEGFSSELDFLGKKIGPKGPLEQISPYFELEVETAR